MISPELLKELLAEEAKQLRAAYYQAGLEEGIRRFAHWKDGEQFVGTCGKTLKAALKELE
jgi:hypothetical protein